MLSGLDDAGSSTAVPPVGDDCDVGKVAGSAVGLLFCESTMIALGREDPVLKACMICGRDASGERL